MTNEKISFSRRFEVSGKWPAGNSDFQELTNRFLTAVTDVSLNRTSTPFSMSSLRNPSKRVEKEQLTMRALLMNEQACGSLVDPDFGERSFQPLHLNSL
jgi:hypothetical protein